MNGWIMLHRQIRDHWLYQNPVYFHAWVTMLMEANHCEKKVLIDGEIITCGVGQSVHSLNGWANVFGGDWTTQKVRTFFALLQKSEIINTEGLRKTTRVTICKYALYQNKQQGDNTENNTEITRSQQGDNKEATTNNNYNNSNNGTIKEIIIDCNGEFLQNSPTHTQNTFNDFNTQILNQNAKDDEILEKQNEVEKTGQNNAQNETRSETNNCLFVETERIPEAKAIKTDNAFAVVGGAEKIKAKKMTDIVAVMVNGKYEVDYIASKLPESINKQYTSIAYSFFRLFVETFTLQNIKPTSLTNAKLDNYITDIRLIIEKDGQSLETIRKAYKYLNNESVTASFSWRANIKSMSKLREKLPDVLAAANRQYVRDNQQSIELAKAKLTVVNNLQKRLNEQNDNEYSIYNL